MDQFWEMKLRCIGERTEALIVVDVGELREMYYIGEPKPGWQGRGHGGQEFWIRLLENNLIFSCNDLWHSGTIPKKLRDEFQPNAELLEIPFNNTTVPFFWDCECVENHHHSKHTEMCMVCKAVRDEQPDAIRTEVKPHEITTLWLLARLFLTNKKHKCRYCGDLYFWQEGMDPWYCSEQCRKERLEDLYSNVGLNDMQRQVNE